MTPEQAAAFSAESRAKAEAVVSEFPLAFIAQIDLAGMASEPEFTRRCQRPDGCFSFSTFGAVRPSSCRVRALAGA